MSILFGNQSRSQSKNLVEFRAGKMNMTGSTVSPDKRKGLIYVHQAEDSLMHFCWKDRGSGVVEDDLIIFPDDVEYKRVTQCTTGRAFLLKFKSSNRRMFFWMQEPKSDKDEDLCKRVNDVLNNPPPPGSSRSGGSTPAGELANLETLLSGDSELQSLLSGMGQQQLRQLMGVSNLSSILGTPAPAAAVTQSGNTPVTSTSTNQSSSITPTSNSAVASQLGTIQLSQLQNILSGLRVPESERSEQPNQSPPHIDLSSGMSSDVLEPILSNPEFIQRLQGMLPQTGEAVPTTQQIQETLQSPQFQQALSSFSAAMQSGQLAPLMNQFGLENEAVGAAAQGDMESFVRALQSALHKSSDQQTGSSEAKKKDDKNGKPKKDDDDEEDMALD